MTKVRILLTFVLMCTVGVPAFAGACKKDPRVTEACFSVHGRLSFYNGGPSTRLWVIGTHHMLGLPTEEAELPPNLKPLMQVFEDEVYGDFLVCPYHKHVAGSMQMVCIESAKHLAHRRSNR